MITHNHILQLQLIYVYIHSNYEIDCLGMCNYDFKMMGHFLVVIIILKAEILHGDWFPQTPVPLGSIASPKVWLYHNNYFPMPSGSSTSSEYLISSSCATMTTLDCEAKSRSMPQL